MLCLISFLVKMYHTRKPQSISYRAKLLALLVDILRYTTINSGIGRINITSIYAKCWTK